MKATTLFTDNKKHKQKTKRERETGDMCLQVRCNIVCIDLLWMQRDEQKTNGSIQSPFFNRKYTYIQICVRYENNSSFLCFTPLVLLLLLLRWRVDRSEVGEAAGVFLVLVRDEEDGLVEVVVAEFLKGDGGRDGREDGDVCGGGNEGKTKCVTLYFGGRSSL